MIQFFQGEHSNEFLIAETKEGVKDGKAQLFDNGVISMSCMFENGLQKGNITTYKNGVADAIRSWDRIVADLEDRCIENRKCGLLMVIRDNETDQIVYEGSYDNEMQKNGYGFEFDTQTGKRIHYGYFENDEMIQLIYEFNDDQMTEYKVIDKESNILPYQRRPVYMGGYLFIEEEQRVVRHGDGVEINYLSGIAEYVGVWIKGAKKNDTHLHDGWYKKAESEVSLKLIVDEVLSEYEESRMTGEDSSETEMDEEEKMARQQRDEEEMSENQLTDVVVQSNVDIESLSSTVRMLTVEDYKCNEEIDTLKIWYKPYLKRIVIGNHCFNRVTDVRIKENNQLESIVVKNNSFTCKNKSASLTVTDNPMVTNISIGKESFKNFGSFILKSKRVYHLLE